MSLSPIFKQILEKHHLFSSLNDEEMGLLLKSAQLLNLQKNEIFCLQEKPADHFYFVVSGCIKLFRSMPDGNEKILELITDNNTFAEALMFLDKKAYPVTAQAAIASQVISFSSSAYLKLLEGNTQLALSALGKLSIRLRQRINEIETLSLKNAVHKVTRYIVSNVDMDTTNPVLEMQIAKRLVAQQLSMQPETFSRVIHRLKEEGIIKIDGKVITVLDRMALVTFEE